MDPKPDPKVRRTLLPISLVIRGRCNGDDYLQRYVDFSSPQGRHRDNYVEEYHRKFFTNYARGGAPRKVAVAPTSTSVGSPTSGCYARSFAENRISAILGGSGLREMIFEYGSDWFTKRKAEQWSREADEVVIGHRVGPACYIADAHVGGDNCHRAQFSVRCLVLLEERDAIAIL